MAIYYVSNTGSDSNNGITTSTPWATLTKVNNTTFVPGDIIKFKRGGTWYGYLDPKASGTALNPITYDAYDVGSNPIITGFITISGWANEGGGIYSKVITSDALTNMVTINDVVREMGRYPKTGEWLTYESYTMTNPGYTITDSSLSTTPNDWTGAEAVVYINGWDINRMNITNHVDDTLTLETLSWDGNSIDDVSNPYYYFIQNDIRTLTEFGDWYHDFGNTNKFYMYFGLSANPNDSIVKVATKNYLVRDYDGYKYLIYKNLEFSGALNAGIQLYTGQDYCSVQYCTIKQMGGAGIKAYGNYILIDNNTFNNIEGAGIIIFGNGQTISNNNFNTINMTEGQGANQNVWRGAIANFRNSGGSPIDFIANNNTVIDTGFDGFMFGANVPLTATVTNNYLENTCYWRQDQGAIYTSGKQSTQVNILIEGNIVINCYGDGIYLDELSENCTVRNNTVEGSGRGGIFLHRASNCTVTGNIAVGNSVGLKISSWLNEARLRNLTVTNNQFVAVESIQKCISYSTREVAYATSFATWNFSNNVYARPIDDNLTITTNLPTIGEAQKTLAQWKTFTGQDTSSIKSPKPINTTNDIYFYYNETKVNKTVPLPNAAITMTGTEYVIDITLLPFKSTILLRKGTDYYVSNTGSDSNNGLSTSTPWQTLTKVNGITFAASDRINFKGGDTWYGQLNVNQSGQLNKPITYTSYGAGQATITALTDITLWDDLGDNIWESINPVSTLSQLNIVLIDDTNTPMGRMPKIDNVYIFESYNTNVSITCSDLTGTPNWTGAEVVIRKRGWSYEVGTVASQSGSTIFYTDPGVYDIENNGCGFFFQGNVNCLTQQNDWYYNKTTKKLKIYSVGAPTNVQVPSFDTLLKVPTSTSLFNKDFITFENIEFRGANSKAISINTADNIEIRSCKFKYNGQEGVRTNADNNTIIDGCEFDQNNAEAIYAGTGNGIKITNNIVTNTNLIPGIGSVYGLGAISITQNNCLAQYNNVQYSGYDGIICASPQILYGLVKNNFVNYSLMILSDGGGIYTGNMHTDLIIEENIILNSIGAPLGSPNSAYPIGAPYGYTSAKGIYFDRVSNNVTARNNTVIGCEMGITMSTDCVGNTFEGNIVFDCEWAIQITQLFSTVPSNTRNNRVIGNQFVTKLASSTIAKYQSIIANDMQNFFTEIDNNIYARPMDDTDTIWFYQPSMTTPKNYQPLSVWASFIGQEANSTTSPYTITSENDVYIIYNDSKQIATKSIPFNSKDLLGNIYRNTVTLDPYRSIILFRDETVVPDTTPPIISNFTIPAISNNLLTPILVFTATDEASGVTGYLVTETSNIPNLSNPLWSPTPWEDYIFDSYGSKILYAWAKDSSNNISDYMAKSIILQEIQIEPSILKYMVKNGRYMYRDTGAGKIFKTKLV